MSVASQDDTVIDSAPRVEGDGEHHAAVEAAGVVVPTLPAAAPPAEKEPRPEDESQEEARLWAELSASGAEAKLVEALTSEITKVEAEFSDITERYCVLGLYARSDSIGPFEADHIHEALSRANGSRQKDILLFMVSRGGRIEPGYQIALMCRRYARATFAVALPREAKSAATLVSLGADSVHMGEMAELGPIDPQLGGLPALGVEQALRTLASIASEYPKSANMLANYLRQVVTIEQIGYCQRIADSAVQYAERLLLPKRSKLAKAPLEIAQHLVFGYKDHDFVIDRDEATGLLGAELVISGSREVAFAERVYKKLFLFDLVSTSHKKHLEIVGVLRDGVMFWDDR